MASVLVLVSCALASADTVAAAGATRPIVIAHRGASGYRPEHTASAYRLAIDQGADYIEPDLVMTKDGVLVARHENEIGRTTDVASHPQFANRRTTRTIEGETFTGWFAEDFTLAEIKTLRARERDAELRPESARHDEREPILTLQEIVEIARAGAKARRRDVGLYIEIKNPLYHAAIGLPLERKLAEVLAAAGLDRPDAPVFVQSFWPQALQTMRSLTRVRLMLLLNSVAPPADVLRQNGIVSWPDVYSAAGLKRIATFADAVGPEIGLLFARDETGRLGTATSFVADAHAAGLLVHAWSVAAENRALPPGLRRGDSPAVLGDADALFRSLFALGIDGIFTDHPDIAVRVKRGTHPPSRAPSP